MGPAIAICVGIGIIYGGMIAAVIVGLAMARHEGAF
jgi:hypothetical protein